MNFEIITNNDIMTVTWKKIFFNVRACPQASTSIFGSAHDGANARQFEMCKL